MALIRWRPRREWDPFTDMLDLQNNINRLFSLSLGRKGAGEPTAWNPSMDVYREGDNYILKTELPGIKKEDLEITIQDNIVTLKGEKKDKRETKEDDYYFSERCFGSFQRAIELPAAIDRSKVKANVKDGILEVRLPLAEEAVPKQIKIDIS